MHLRDHFPSPLLLHMAASMTFIMIPYVDDVLIIFGDMIGGMTHRLDVSIGNETSNIYSCFKGSMGHYMAATLHHLFPYEGSHMIDLCLWEEPLTWKKFFYELPFWRVIHFIWMIAWRMDLHMGMKVTYIFWIYTCSFLRTCNIWEGRFVIFLN